MKRCLTLFISREIQIKTAVEYHFLPTRMAAIKILNNKGWRDCGVIGILAHYWWEYKIMWSLWKTAWWLLK